MAITIDCTVQPHGTIPPDNVLMFALCQAICALNDSGATVTEYLLDRREPPTDRFLTRVTFADGRVWKEWVDYDGTINSNQQFDLMPHAWTAAIFVRLRPIRNLMYQVLQAFPTLDTIRYTFTP